MNKGILIAWALLAGTLELFAQDVKQRKPCSCEFRSLNQAGILVGEAGTFFQLQTINGVRFGSWFTGLGLGLDYYGFRTIPLFLHIQKNLLEKNKTPFFYGSAGIHFPWVEAKSGSDWYHYEYNNGLYYDIGAGYLLRLKNNNAFSLSIGYSLKHVTERKYGQVWCITGNCPEELIESSAFDLRRISIKLGFSF